MFTRKDCLAGKCSHDEYYGQFITEMAEIKALNILKRSKFSKEEIIEKIKDDRHLNFIPLSLWDGASLTRKEGDMMKQCGDYLTLSGKVSILKTCARKIIKSWQQL